ncbi:MAG: LLM class F420-dependent oxidoreductase, partial [Solirubrobacteraceae bacterium]
VAEHSHIPVSRLTPYPGGSELPEWYKRTWDPFIALTLAASVTTRIRVGTGVCLLIQRDPIHTAKQVASLDQASNGRFLFGVGGGWNRDEMEDHGTDFGSRWKRLREEVEAMRALWTEEEASYHGDLVRFDATWAWPKPVQKPYPPVLLGGNGPRTLQRVVRYADGWLPNGRGYLERIPELQSLAEAAGRRPIPVSAYPPQATPEIVERHREAGVERLIWYVPPTGRDAALARLEELTLLIERFR